MAINSTAFLLFFIVVFLVYYIPLKNHVQAQNLWLLLCSYFSFAVVEWRMLPLLIGATVLFYGLGFLIGTYNHTHERRASGLTTFGTLIGIGILVYFKYLNFLIDNVTQLLEALGFQTHSTTLHILMPIGVSFFTFKLISYLVEVHRGHLQPCRNFITFATYVAFFPTLLSGPIDRPKPFLSQLQSPRLFIESLSTDGLRQILWGLFKKAVIADALTAFVDTGWSHTNESTSLSLFLVALIYPIQLYADFSSYSDMAIGVSKLLGLKIAKNFNYPFFARHMADYWRRWHMSLTTWLTDYVFMPLNILFRDFNQWGLIFACIINMVVVGIWHGANWTYALFGLYHGLLFIPLILNGDFASRKKMKLNGYLPTLADVGKMLLTYLLVAIGLVIFRAPNLDTLGVFLTTMLQGHDENALLTLDATLFPLKTLLFVFLMLGAEWVAMVQKKEYALQLIAPQKAWLRYTLYSLLTLLYLLKVGGTHQFIYAQF